MDDSTSVSVAHRPLNPSPVRRFRRKPFDPSPPVVKLTPFLSERENTWCKDKSLPEFYEKPDIIHTSTEAFVKPPPTAFSTSSDSMLTSRENRPILPLSDLNKPNVEASHITHIPPKTSPSKVRLFDDPTPPESIRGRKLVFPPTPRDQCISPENPIKRLPRHGYAPTIGDRERKTEKESPVTKPTSLLNRERTQEFVSKQQVLRLRGLRMMDIGHLAPAPSTYFAKPGAMPMKSLEEFYRHLVSSYNRGYAFSPIKTRLGHHPTTPVNNNSNNNTHPAAVSGQPAMMFNPRGRYVSEPLIALNHENVSERLHHSMDQTDGKAAFRLLETAGKPTSIEQNLERDYTMFRDTTKRGVTPATGQHFTRYLKLKNYNPTQGELFIMVNKEQNRPGGWTSKASNSSRFVGQLGRDSQTLGGAESSWYQNADDRDIPVSPDMTAAQAAEVQARKESIETKAMLEEADDQEKKSPDPFDKTPAESVEPPERIEITTTLPDINTPSPTEEQSESEQNNSDS